MADLNREREFENIPKGYQCSQNGVKLLTENGEEDSLITLKPVLVKALSRDEAMENWGVLVWWVDLDGNEHQEAIPKRLLHAQGVEAAQQLIDGGLPVVHGKEKALLRYLSIFDVKERLIAATCTGWMGESFVLPNEVLNQPEGQSIVYQPQGGISNTAGAINKRGNLEAWKKEMADASSMVMFAVCVALSAPLRLKLNIEAGGFHAYNLTSQGKTTMLQAAASVWGNGVDPAIAGGDAAYIQRWNSTANALEAKAEVFNDLPMIVDEIGEGDPKEFGPTIYRILSGTGRGRANRSGGLRDSKSWRVTILSAGEIAVSDFIESGGGNPKGGQLVRMVDLDLASIGKLFDNAEETDAMKQTCATHYGHAGPALLEKISDLAAGWHSFDKSVVGEAVTAIAKRVRARFALIAYTGVMAVDAGILPWSKSVVLNAVRCAYSSWHEQINIVSDVDRGVAAVRDFILKHESRFDSGNGSPPKDRAGWVKGDMFHFTPAAFKEACGGTDQGKVKLALKEAGLLYSNKTKGLISTHWVDGKNVSVVSIKSQIISDSSKKDGGGSAGSESLDATTSGSLNTHDREVVRSGEETLAEDNYLTIPHHFENKVVSPENRINEGAPPPSPPSPPSPPKNNNHEVNLKTERF